MKSKEEQELKQTTGQKIADKLRAKGWLAGHHFKPWLAKVEANVAELIDKELEPLEIQGIEILERQLHHDCGITPEVRRAIDSVKGSLILLPPQTPKVVAQEGDLGGRSSTEPSNAQSPLPKDTQRLEAVIANRWSIRCCGIYWRVVNTHGRVIGRMESLTPREAIDAAIGTVTSPKEATGAEVEEEKESLGDNV